MLASPSLVFEGFKVSRWFRCILGYKISKDMQLIPETQVSKLYKTARQPYHEPENILIQDQGIT